MAISHERLQVSAYTPTMVTIPGREKFNSTTIQVQNLGEGAMYLGGAGLTETEYGVSIVPGGAVTVDRLSADDELYALAQIDGEYVAVLRVSR